MNTPDLWEEQKTAPLEEGFSQKPQAAGSLPSGEELKALSDGYPCFICLADGVVTPIQTKIFVAGFSPRCDLAISENAAAHTVSRFHATITASEDGTLYLKDESLNGTYFGTDPEDPDTFARLPKGNDVQLKDGCYVRFATVLYQFRQGERRPR